MGDWSSELAVGRWFALVWSIMEIVDLNSGEKRDEMGGYYA